jgi:hypothetical protein
MVASALAGCAWIRDITGALMIPILIQYLQLRQQLDTIDLSLRVEDQITWKWSSSGQYSYSSAYAVMFYGQSVVLGAKELWKVRAPNEFKLFFWLAIQNRCWTLECLAHHGLRNNGLCTLCKQSKETISHMVLGCVYSREIWFRGLRRCGWQHLTPRVDDNLVTWWLRVQKVVTKLQHPAFDSLCFLIAWSLWLEWNARVFREQTRMPNVLANANAELGELWCRARVVARSELLGE